jgi:endonuclease YncB( thermonuclease family)
MKNRDRCCIGWAHEAGISTLPAITLLLTALLLTGATAVAAPASISSYARVQDDGTLVIDGYRIRLHGIYLPPTERSCQHWIRPPRCADRAVLALEFKVQGFVHCFPVQEFDDGSLSATCYVDRSHFEPGEDLSAYLIRQGWAMALPDAPFEYHALQEIARHRGLGVWGFPADQWY